MVGGNLDVCVPNVVIPDGTRFGRGPFATDLQAAGRNFASTGFPNL